MKQILDNKPVLALGLKLAIVIAFALAVTVPFAAQPFSLDGALVVDFASSQIENPLNQHIDDFDYFGVHYDRFTNTHPRFLSLFLSIVIRWFGASEIPVHLALALFPIIGGIAMYFLAKRFRLSGLGAALFFLAGPAALVSSHMEMVDMPGTCLWVASLTAFIYGVDRNSRKLLALAGGLFILTIFTFYQGLTVLGLALTYLVLKKRIALGALAPIVLPAAVFLAYLWIFNHEYGELPRFTYRIPLPGYDKNVFSQTRGLAVILGGTMMFPLVMLGGFIRNWRIALAGALAAACAWPWLLVRHIIGSYSLYETLALGLLVVVGVVTIYAILESTFLALVAWLRRQNNDFLLLAAWFIAVFIYNAAFLGYPSPRYFLPALPTVVLMMLWFWRGVWSRRRYLRAAIAGGAFSLTLLYSLAIGIAYLDYAREGRDTAAWAAHEYGDYDGRVWFDGELGYAYYMRQNGFTMVPSILWQHYSHTYRDDPAELPEPGDIIITSRLAGSWLPYPDVLPYMRLEEVNNSWADYPLVAWSYDDRSSWAVSLLLPFVLTDRPLAVDEITVWRIVDEPAPLAPAVKEEVEKWR